MSSSLSFNIVRAPAITLTSNEVNFPVDAQTFNNQEFLEDVEVDTMVALLRILNPKEVFFGGGKSRLKRLSEFKEYFLFVRRANPGLFVKLRQLLEDDSRDRDAYVLYQASSDTTRMISADRFWAYEYTMARSCVCARWVPVISRILFRYHSGFAAFLNTNWLQFQANLLNGIISGIVNNDLSLFNAVNNLKSSFDQTAGPQNYRLFADDLVSRVFDKFYTRYQMALNLPQPSLDSSTPQSIDPPTLPTPQPILGTPASPAPQLDAPPTFRPPVENDYVDQYQIFSENLTFANIPRHLPFRVTPAIAPLPNTNENEEDALRSVLNVINNVIVGLQKALDNPSRGSKNYTILRDSMNWFLSPIDEALVNVRVFTSLLQYVKKVLIAGLLELWKIRKHQVLIPPDYALEIFNTSVITEARNYGIVGYVGDYAKRNRKPRVPSLTSKVIPYPQSYEQFYTYYYTILKDPPTAPYTVGELAYLEKATPPPELGPTPISNHPSSSSDASSSAASSSQATAYLPAEDDPLSLTNFFDGSPPHSPPRSPLHSPLRFDKQICSRFIEASKFGSTTVVASIMNQVDDNQRSQLLQIKKKGLTALDYATKYEHAAVVSLLEEKNK